MPDNIQVELYEAPDAPGRYHDHVQRLIDADATRSQDVIDSGKHFTTVIRVPTIVQNSKGEDKDGVVRYKRYFQDSANALGVTAREVIKDRKVEGDDTLLRFYVVPLITRPRGDKEEDADADTPDSEAETAA